MQQSPSDLLMDYSNLFTSGLRVISQRSHHDDFSEPAIMEGGLSSSPERHLVDKSGHHALSVTSAAHSTPSRNSERHSTGSKKGRKVRRSCDQRDYPGFSPRTDSPTVDFTNSSSSCSDDSEDFAMPPTPTSPSIKLKHTSFASSWPAHRRSRSSPYMEWILCLDAVDSTKGGESRQVGDDWRQFHNILMEQND